MFIGTPEARKLEDEIKGLRDKILDFMTDECSKHGYSASTCYIAMKVFLFHWSQLMGPELVEKTEKSFKLIPRGPQI